MKSAFTLATLAAVAAAAKNLGVIISSTGTVLHQSSIGIQNSQVITPGGDAPELELNDKQQLVNKKTGKYIVVEDNILVESSEPGTLWSLENNNLTPTAGALQACQEGEYYLLGAERQCSGGKIDIHLTAVDVHDIGADDGEGNKNQFDQGGYSNSTTTEPGPPEYTTTTIPCPKCEGGATTIPVPVPQIPKPSKEEGDHGHVTTIPVPPESTNRPPPEFTTTTIPCPKCEGGYTTIPVPVPQVPQPSKGNEGDATTIPVPVPQIPKPSKGNEGERTTIPVPPESTNRPPPQTTNQPTLAGPSREPETHQSTGVVPPPQIDESNGASQLGLGAAAAIAAIAMIV